VKITDNSGATITNVNEMKKGVFYRDKEGDIWMIAYHSHSHNGGYLCLMATGEPFVINQIEGAYFPLTRFEGTISN